MYLAAVMDLYSGKVVGWAMEKQMTQNLVMEALKQAVGRARSPSDVTQQLIATGKVNASEVIMAGVTGAAVGGFMQYGLAAIAKGIWSFAGATYNKLVSNSGSIIFNLAFNGDNDFIRPSLPWLNQN